MCLVRSARKDKLERRWLRRSRCTDDEDDEDDEEEDEGEEDAAATAAVFYTAPQELAELSG